MSNGVLVLMSGGLDSWTCALMAKQNGILKAGLFMDYDQPAKIQELNAALKCASICGAPLHRERLQGLLMDSSEGEGPRVVPGRNEAFLRAASKHYDQIWIGAIADDASEYEDCRPEWIAKMNASGLKVYAPLIRMSKVDVMREFVTRGGNIRHVWSCYVPINGKPCHACNSCKQLGFAWGEYNRKGTGSVPLN
jgi:7-cyano-7-deazaguanine synthase